MAGALSAPTRTNMGTLTIERGDADHPAGHAIPYLPGGAAAGATSILLAPITFDLGRYVPPLLASSLGSSGILAQTSFFPIPPVPEKLSIDELRRLASWRGDDIIVDRSVVSSDPTTLMARVAEIGDAYARAYQDRLESAPVEEPRSSRGESRSENVEGLALLYSTLPEHERIEEMARRLGKLRYAAEGNDGDLVDATCAEMRAIAAYL